MKSSSAQIHPYTSHILHPTIRQSYNNTTLPYKSVKPSNKIPPSNKAPNQFDKPSSNYLRSVKLPQVSTESDQDEDNDFVMPSQPMPYDSTDPDHYYTDLAAHAKVRQKLAFKF